jgi:hypothetical protein
MIKSELLRDQGILIIAPDGPIAKADFKRLANEIDPVIASKGKLAGVMIYAKSFPGWDSFGAFVSHFKFVANHHRQIDRVAAVTDSGLRTIVSRIVQPFVTPQIRVFDFAQKAQALDWLEAGK